MVPAAVALVPVAIAGAQTVFRMIAPTIAKKLIKEGLIKRLPSSAITNAKKIPKASEKEIRELVKIHKSGKPSPKRDMTVRQKPVEKRLGEAWQNKVNPKPELPKSKIVDRSKPKNPDEVLDAAWTKKAGPGRKRSAEKKPPKSGKIKLPPKSNKSLTAKQKAILAGLVTAGGVGGGSAALNKKDKDKLPPLEEKGYVDTILKPQAVVYKKPIKKSPTVKRKEPPKVVRKEPPKVEKTDKKQDKHWREIKKISKALGVKYEVPIDDEHGIPLDPDMRVDSDYKGGLVGKPKKGTKSKSKRKTSSTKNRKGFGGKGSGAALRGY